MPTEPKSKRSPRARALYYLDLANMEELTADGYAADRNQRLAAWHNRNAQSYRDQAQAIMANATKD